MNKRLIGIAEQVLFACFIFTLVLVLFHDRLVVPYWVQPLGRMHPLLLHFPIVILLLAVGLDLFRFQPANRANDVYQRLARILLLVGALSAGFTVVMGLLLAREDGYSGSALFWHKWAGVGVFFLSASLYWISNKPWYRIRVAQVGALATVVLLLGAGHYGATLTHGTNFLFEPISQHFKPAPVLLGQAVVFTDVIQPILEQKCVSCHNPDKLKGELALTSEEAIRRGGKTGKLFVPGRPDISLLLQRIHLPVDEKKHMPPSGKSQLTPQEMTLLALWVKRRAGFNQKVVDLPATDSLRVLASTLFKPAIPTEQPETYAFDAADEETINQLSTDYRTVAPLARESPALAVNLYNKATYTPEKLAELKPIRQQIVYLNVNKLPVTDADLTYVSQFENLQKLDANFTDITGKGLKELALLKHLKSLALTGTALTYADVQRQLGAFKSLKSLSLWETGLTATEIRQLQKAYPRIQLIAGYNGTASAPIRLNPPQIKNPVIFTESVSLQLNHPIKGVQIRYTTDGSEPDSLNGRLSDAQTLLTTNTTIKAKAYKPGWLSSDVVTFNVYKSTYKPDSVRLLMPLNPVHQAAGANTFFDGKLGTFNANSPAWANNWAGFRKYDMVLVSEFKKPVSLTSVALRVMVEEETGIFPPGTVEIWGGTNWDQLKKLAVISPELPIQKSAPVLKAVTGTFSLQRVSCLKIIARPVKQLPTWHANKGKPALLLVDEVFIN